MSERGREREREGGRRATAIPATCRACGARGREIEDDPAPGICPDCLDQRLQTAMARLRYLSRVWGRERALEYFESYLIQRVEMTPAAAQAARMAFEEL